MKLWVTVYTLTLNERTPTPHFANICINVTCTSSHGEKPWPSRLHWKEVVGPEPANSTVAVSPFTVTPSLIRCTVHVLGFAVFAKKYQAVVSISGSTMFIL